MIQTNEPLADEKPSSMATYWKNQITLEERAHKDWREFGKVAEDEYTAKKGEGARYNILWSNVQVQMGALYQATGNPQVRRRNRDDKGAQKEAAMVLERAISFQIDNQDFDGNVKRAENDLLVVGMGQARVRYDATIEKVLETEMRPVMDDNGMPRMQPMAQMMAMMGGEMPMMPMMQEVEIEVEQIVNQAVLIEFYSWKNFHWQPAKSWSRVEWVAFDHYKSKKAVMEDYGVKGEETDDDDDGEKHIKVTEVWHKPSKTIIVIGEQFAEPLEIREDKLGLESFFPCPKPMVLNLHSQKFEAISDFWFYKSQAKQLNKTITRIDALANSVRDVGFYDASFTEMASLTNKKDGDLVPVDNLLDKIASGNMQSVIVKKPILETSQVIQNLAAYAQGKKEEIYEILGISDIVRGASQTGETATAQRIKSQYASLRIRDKQQVVAYFVRDIFRLMGEIIGEHFEAEILGKMTGVEISEEVMAILRDDVMRAFSVDIESDSTLAMDEAEEQQARMEAVTAIGTTMERLLPMVAQNLISKDVAKELLAMAVGGYKYATNLEDVIDAEFAEPDPNSPEHQQMMQEMQQEMQRLQQDNEGMQQALQEIDELDKYDKEAKIRRTNAETDYKKAETVEQQVENVANIQAAQMGYGTPYRTG